MGCLRSRRNQNGSTKICNMWILHNTSPLSLFFGYKSLIFIIFPPNLSGIVMEVVVSRNRKLGTLSTEVADRQGAVWQEQNTSEWASFSSVTRSLQLSGTRGKTFFQSFSSMHTTLGKVVYFHITVKQSGHWKIQHFYEQGIVTGYRGHLT